MPTKPDGCCKVEGGKKQQAIMVDGQRYTCEKCRKGHRTGTCNHLVDDNGNPSLLQKTNRAGRPNTTSKCRCPSSDHCTCVKTWYLVVRIPKSEIEPGREGENNCRIVGTVIKPLRERNERYPEGEDHNHGGTLIASSTASSGHRCTCGEECACTYCPEHPENQATHDHNQYLANRNRPSNAMPYSSQQFIESSSQNCGGTAVVSYACSSDDSAAGQEAMLSTIPLNDQKYHYQVYSGQYPCGGCVCSCRCPGCITWRVIPSVKQQLLGGGYNHEDCPPKCNCPGCWTYRERQGCVEFPILSLEEFFAPSQRSKSTFDAFSAPSTTSHQVCGYNDIASSPQCSMIAFHASPLTPSVSLVQSPTPHRRSTQASSVHFNSPYATTPFDPFSPMDVELDNSPADAATSALHQPLSPSLHSALQPFT